MPLIEFYNLSQEEQNIFFQCGLDRVVRIAQKILVKHLGDLGPRASRDPHFTSQMQIRLDTLIKEILELIGKQSNARFGSEAYQQHRFFSKPGERETFPFHLSISRWREKVDQLEKKSPTSQRQLLKNSENKKQRIFSKEMFKRISASKKVTFGNSKMTESETRAVGVLYMTSLVWLNVMEERQKQGLQSNTAIDIPRLVKSGLDLFSMLSDTDQIAARAEGGKKFDKKEEFRPASEIVLRIVKAAPSKNSNVLAKLAAKEIESAFAGDRAPAFSWILKEVRKIKKSLAGN